MGGRAHVPAPRAVHEARRRLEAAVWSHMVADVPVGVAVPTDPWFRGPLRELVQAIITDPATTGWAWSAGPIANGSPGSTGGVSRCGTGSSIL